MEPASTAIPLQILSHSPSARLQSVVPGQMLRRSSSLPPRPAAMPPRAGRSESQENLPQIRDAVARGSHSHAAGLSEPMVNMFLRKIGLQMELRGDRLAITRYPDIEAAEAQRAPSIRDLTQISHALMLAENTPAQMEIAKTLLPVVNALLVEHAQTKETGDGLKDWVKTLARNYCSVLGGRDLAIDDAIGAINTYFFDVIGSNTALNRSNIAAAALTATLMLMPTIGKNLPVIVGAVREGRYQDAVLPALSICAIAAMALNPTTAAIGLDRASAIAAAAGNALMMANLPEIIHDGREWAHLKQTRFTPETHPFTCLARDEGLIDLGLHTALDFVHEIGAQAGFFALNIRNAVQGGDSARSPATFPLLSLLLGSFALDTARGDRPFAEFAADHKALAGEVAGVSHHDNTRRQAARLLLQQKIAETYDADYRALLRPLAKRSAMTQATRQLGGNTLSDADEKTFLKGLISRFCASEDARNTIRVAIDRIYKFDRFDPAEYAGGDAAVGEILRFVQSERNRDKGLLCGSRGLAYSDHVYSGVIAHAVKSAALQELQRNRA